MRQFYVFYLNALTQNPYMPFVHQPGVQLTNNQTIHQPGGQLLTDSILLQIPWRHHVNLFFMAGYIESWGRGTIAIVEECLINGLPLPLYSEHSGGFMVEFFKTKRMSSSITPQVTPQAIPQVTPQVKQLILALKGEMTRYELQSKLLGNGEND